MQLRPNESEIVKREIMRLLHLQMEALESLKDLPDEKLVECYLRQDRILELREKLQREPDEAYRMPSAA